MKKFFLFAIAVVAAMSINAEQIFFTEVASKGSLNGAEFTDGSFVLTVTDTDGSKLEIDANNCWFGDEADQVKFTHRLKTGGKSSSKNALTLSIPAAGTLYVYARTGSNSATDRNIVLTQDEATLLDHILLESEAIKVKGLDSKDPDKETNVYPILSCEVAAGTVEIAYPVNGVNFYGFSLGNKLNPEGIEEIIAAPKATKIVYNGQVVIVKDGRFFNLLGAEIAL